MNVLHLAIAQFRPRKGDLPGNIRRVGDVLAQAAALAPRPHLVQFPETVLSGYFVEGGVRELSLSATELTSAIAGAYSGPSIDVVIGFYERLDGNLHNSLAYLRVGEGAAELVHVHRKNFLPTYGMFDEERFVERGHGVRAFDAPWGRAAMLVCEDAWHSLTGLIAALDGAHVVFVSSAAPARGTFERADGESVPGSVARWNRLIRDVAEEHGVFVTLASLVGSEGGRMFQGASLVMGPQGDVRACAPIWDETLLTASVDLDDITMARAVSPLLSDVRTMLPTLVSELQRAAGGGGGVTMATTNGDVANTSSRAANSAAVARRAASAAAALITPVPVDGASAAPGAAAVLNVVSGDAAARGAPPPLAIDAPLVERWLVAFLTDEFGRRGFEKAVVGLSGGVDSAVVATLAARALGAHNVTAVRMPYRTSSSESLSHAQLVIDALGIDAETRDISAAVDAYLAVEPGAGPARAGNVMARTRMLVLFDQSARLNALPLGTGNKSERLLGYFTWHADDSPPVNPLGDLFKTQVWELARHLGVPKVVIEKPASADLVAGQTDEGDFGVRYATADAILNLLLHGHRVHEIAERGFAPAEIELVRARLDGTHWKRRLPTVALLSATAIGESYLRPVDY